MTTSVLLFCRLTVAFLFVFSSYRKLLALQDFAVTIGDFKLLPRRWSKTVAWLFLGAEMTIVLCVLLGGYLLAPGFLLATVLLIVFSLALLTALKRHISMSCNCFGRTERPISRYDVARNMLLILWSLVGLFLARDVSQQLTWDTALLLALMSLVFVLCATNLEDIVETLFRCMKNGVNSNGDAALSQPGYSLGRYPGQSHPGLADCALDTSDTADPRAPGTCEEFGTGHRRAGARV